MILSGDNLGKIREVPPLNMRPSSSPKFEISASADANLKIYGDSRDIIKVVLSRDISSCRTTINLLFVIFLFT